MPHKAESCSAMTMSWLLGCREPSLVEMPLVVTLVWSALAVGIHVINCAVVCSAHIFAVPSFVVTGASVCSFDVNKYTRGFGSVWSIIGVDMSEHDYSHLSGRQYRGASAYTQRGKLRSGGRPSVGTALPSR